MGVLEPHRGSGVFLIQIQHKGVIDHDLIAVAKHCILHAAEKRFFALFFNCNKICVGLYKLYILICSINPLTIEFSFSKVSEPELFADLIVKFAGIWNLYGIMLCIFLLNLELRILVFVVASHPEHCKKSAGFQNGVTLLVGKCLANPLDRSR